MKVARPSLPVTMFRADSAPKSTGTPLTRISARSGTPETGWPCALRTITETTDWDAPSCCRTSGVTWMVRDVPNSDGPVSGGASWSFMVQDAMTAVATTSATSRVIAFIYEPGLLRSGTVSVCPVCEMHTHLTGGEHFASGLVVAVEGDLGDRRDHQQVVHQGPERRLGLRLGAYEGEGDGRRIQDGAGKGAVERIGDVDAFGIAAVTADVAHAVAIDGDLIVRAQGRPTRILRLEG